MSANLDAQLARLRELETEFDAAVERAKLTAIYNLAYGLSHEFNNPLANISSRAQALLLDEKDPERRRKLAAINAQAFRGHEMIADLMLYAKPPQLRKESLDLSALVAQAVAEMQAAADQQQTLLVFQRCDAVSVSVDRAALLEAIKAVLKNSLEALGEAGSVTLRIESNPSEVALIIADTGPGIPPAVRPHIFDPYYSGREAGRGLGLGLSKTWRILDLHGGRVEVESRGGKGAEFRLVLTTTNH